MDIDTLKHLPIDFIYAAFAIFGGVARYLNGYVEGHKFSAGIFFASAGVAGFSGLMFALLGQSMQFPQTIQMVMAGTGGFFGEQTMKPILEYFQNRVK